MEDFSGLFAGVVGMALVFAIIFMIIGLGLLIVYLVGRWKLYEKAGREGWKSIIPFYNDWVYVEMAGLNWWYFLLLIANSLSVWVNVNDDVSVGTGLFSLITLIGSFFCNYNISKKLHKDTVFAILMTIAPFIVIPIIGFSGKYTWDDSVTVSVNGPIDDYNNNKNNNNSSNVNNDTKDDKDKNYKYCSHCGAKVEDGNKYCSKCGKEI